jgi:gluconolactonase
MLLPSFDHRKLARLLTLAAIILPMNLNARAKAEVHDPIGHIARLDPAIDKLVPADAQMEVICQGFAWCEGPVWVRDRGFLLFSDIPHNAIMRWDEEAGCSLYLKPAGYTGASPRGGESGSNGLALDRQGRLILCQHGDRRVARLNSSWDDPKPNYLTLSDRYDGKRFNSPNDAVVHSSGAIYFTDPPYGLEKNVDDPAKELPFQGVYRIAPDGSVTLLTKELERPNGIAFSPNEKTLYVANSHGPRPIIMAFPVKEGGTLGNGRQFFSARELSAKHEGACDGMTVDAGGNVFATVPGGVAILTPEGKQLGLLNIGDRTSNCEFGEDGATLFITANHNLLRIRLSTKGIGY